MIGIYNVASLEEKHMLCTLLYIKDHDGCKKIDIYHAVSPNPRMPEKLDILVELGLIRMEQANKKCYIFLTEKGWKFCEHLQKMEDCLSEGSGE